jgi:hypothetical protein
MAIVDDPSIYTADFGSEVVVNGNTGTGILDAPGEVIIDGMVMSFDYSLTVPSELVDGVTYGTYLTVNGVTFSVKENKAQQDGLFNVVTLSKLSPDLVAPGGMPREWNLSDLADAGTANIKAIAVLYPQAGDQFTLLKAEEPITLTEITGVMRGTGSVEVEIRYALDRSATGTLAAPPATISSTTTGDNVTVQNQPVPAEAYIWLVISGVTGTVDELNITMSF